MSRDGGGATRCSVSKGRDYLGGTLIQEPNSPDWPARYGAIRHRYTDLATRLEALTLDLLRSEGIDVIQVESRAKTVQSFAEKIRLKGRHDVNPLTSITDLVGLRVITYYLDDVDKVAELLRREFDVDPANSIDKVEALDSDRFGYRSSHLVVRLTKSRSTLMEWRAFDGIAVEFQVRTSLQHAWAAISHKLEYKSADEAPEGLRRRLYRLSALFELADEQFSVLRDERAATEFAYSEEAAGGGMAEIPIDTSSLAAYWGLAAAAGARFRKSLTARGFATEDATKHDSDRLARDRADLVRVARELGMRSLADLDQYLSDIDRLTPVLDALAEHASDSRDRDLVDCSVEDILSEIMILDFDAIDSLGVEVYAEHVPDLFRDVRARARARGLQPRESASS